VTLNPGRTDLGFRFDQINWLRSMSEPWQLSAVAYAENFHGGISFSGIWWSFIFGVRCL